MAIEMIPTRQQNISYLASFLTQEEMKGSAFERGTYFQIAKQIQAGEKWFLDHRECIRALQPSASLLTTLFQTSLQNPSRETALRLLSEHNRFTWHFIETFERTYPDHPTVVKVKYRKTIQLFKEVIQANFSKEQISEKDPGIFTQAPIQAIQKLIAEKEREVPEIFDAETIRRLREEPDLRSIESIGYNLPRDQLSWIFREVWAGNHP